MPASSRCAGRRGGESRRSGRGGRRAGGDQPQRNTARLQKDPVGEVRRKGRHDAVGRRAERARRLRVANDVEADIRNFARFGDVFHGIIEQILRPAAVGVFEDDVVERIALFIIHARNVQALDGVFIADGCGYAVLVQRAKVVVRGPPVRPVRPRR